MKRFALAGILSAALAGAAGCHHAPRPASTHAAGTGYGVGIPRTNFTPGKGLHAQGDTTGLLHAGVERGNYRPRNVALLWGQPTNRRVRF